MPGRIGPQDDFAAQVKNIAEAFTAEIAGRMHADSDRETPAEMPGFFASISSNLAAMLLLP